MLQNPYVILADAAGMALEYSKVSIPKALMDRLEAFVNSHPEAGYRSPTEAASDGVRRLLEALESRYGPTPDVRERGQAIGEAALKKGRESAARGDGRRE